MKNALTVSYTHLDVYKRQLFINPIYKYISEKYNEKEIIKFNYFDLYTW